MCLFYFLTITLKWKKIKILKDIDHALAYLSDVFLFLSWSDYLGRAVYSPEPDRGKAVVRTLSALCLSDYLS